MTPAKRIKYPVGVQDFERIISGGYLYVDKTELIYDLVNNHDYVFLSRPRRFGKSLLISTLEAYFLGRKDLFKGLAIESLEKDWKIYPVLRLDMATDVYDSVEKLEKTLSVKLSEWERKFGIESGLDNPVAARFWLIINRIYELTGEKVVVLIDEYDKPIVDSLHDSKLLEEIRNRIQGFYSVIKALGNMIQFAMLTGVGKFAHLSIFSGLNNLDDISMDYAFNAICGITEREMHEYFSRAVDEFANANGISAEDTFAQFKEQYDGYHFCQNGEDIYNPFSVLSAFAKKEPDDYWFATGTPSFLVKLLQRNRFPLIKFDELWRSKRQLSDMTDTSQDVVPLLFQAGYITIREYDQRRRQYRLDFPNREVYAGFWESLVEAYFPIEINSSGFDVFTLSKYLNIGDIESFMTAIQSLIASATTDHIADKEEHFQNIMAIICRMLGLEVQTEIHGAHLQGSQAFL